MSPHAHAEPPSQNGLSGENPHPSARNHTSTDFEPLRASGAVEPIAIVGLSFKFSGDADTSESFWETLLEGRSTSGDFPSERLNSAGLYHADGQRKGTLPFKGGHFMKDDIANFDAPFFAISDKEAACMDPQQRGLLETTYRALENAGQPFSRVIGSRTSVYTGCFSNDWRSLTLQDAENCPNYSALGFAITLNANRISWFFNFQGTSLNVDSACSSGMVALDLACKSLISGESNMSIAAGCNLTFYPDIMYAFSSLGLLSPDSKCFSFDSRANGYSRGEGFSVLVLKRLSDALKDNDAIRAVIRSTGSNHDGYTPAIHQPSGKAQAELIKHTYDKAGLSMAKTAFVEAHGTGTPTGDPIEANAIGEAFRESRSSANPLYVGALKSNIGHLEGASGLAGVIKTVLILENGTIPPNANFIERNPGIDVDRLRIKFPTKPTRWPSEGLRRASVNSFGFGGTNAHAVLDDAFHYLQAHGLVGNHSTVESPPQIAGYLNNTASSGNGYHLMADKDPAPRLIVLTAMDKDSLRRSAKDLAKRMEVMTRTCSSQESLMDDLAYTLNSRRTHFPYKSVLVAESGTDLVQVDKRASSPLHSLSKPTVCFVFTGQGAQYAGPELRLLERFDVFRERLQQAENYLLELGCNWRLREELYKDNKISNIHKADHSQPISTAIQIALADLISSFGVHPVAVVGHSSGEVAAGYCIGAISARSAWKIAYYRGMHSAKLVASGRTKGSMLAVGLSEREVQPYITSVSPAVVTVACINSPKSITLSGNRDDIDNIEMILRKEGVFVRRLYVDLAYHSPALNESASDYLASMETIEKGERPAYPVAMISTVTGERIDEREPSEAQYWVRNMLSPVKFSAAIGSLHQHNASGIQAERKKTKQQGLEISHFVELGFHSTLRGPIRDILTQVGGDAGYASVLIRGTSPLVSLHTALGQLYCHGCKLDLEKLNFPNRKLGRRPKFLQNLPEYPFDHSSKYWEEGRISRNIRLERHPKLDLLGKRIPDWNPLEAKWRNFIRLGEMPWVEDHKVNDNVIYPGAGMLVMAIEAANQLTEKTSAISGIAFRDVRFLSALEVPPGEEGVETHVHLRDLRTFNSDTQWIEFRVFSFERNEWHERCRGKICLELDTDAKVDLDERFGKRVQIFKKRYESGLNGVDATFRAAQLYATLEKSGLGFGPAFQRVRAGACSNKHQAVADIDIYNWPAAEYPQRHIVHPCSLDGILHLAIVAQAEGGRKAISTIVPKRLRKLRLCSSGMVQPSSEVKAVTWMTNEHARGCEYSTAVLDSSMTEVLAEVEGLEFTVVAKDEELDINHQGSEQICYHIDWKPDVSVLDSGELSDFCARARMTDAEPVEFYENLTFALLGFLTRAVAEVEDEVAPDPPHLRKYMAWAKMQLELFSKGNLPYTKPEWQSELRSKEALERACHAVSSYSDYGNVFIEVGTRLQTILRGQMDALQFYFENDLLKAIYRDLNNARTCIPELGQCLGVLCHKNPSMKILEVGAGTGGTTEKILSFLTAPTEVHRKHAHRYSSYHYTDISPAFFEQARQDFSQYPNILYETLDIESDPCTQGYARESFDMIIAANVLHATSDMSNTMSNVRALLKPGGKLIMYELTHPDVLRTGFITGLLPGWWLSTEPHRQWTPALSCDHWDRLLRETGFSGVDCELPEYVNPACHEAGILITTATPKTAPELDSSPITLVTSPESTLQRDLAERLRAHLLAERTSGCQILDIQETEHMTDVAENWFIFLTEISGSEVATMSKSAFASIKAVMTRCQGALVVSDAGGDAPGAPDSGAINGLLRVLRNESPQKAYASLGLDKHSSTEAHLRMISNALLVTQQSPDHSTEDMEYKELDGRLHIARVVASQSESELITKKSQPQQTDICKIGDSPPLQLSIETVGFLDSMHFNEDDNIREPLKEDEIEVQVRAIGVSPRDVAIALGRDPGHTMGAECTGVVARTGASCTLQPGARVAVAAAETFKTFVRTKEDKTVLLGPETNYTVAASIPTNFCTAWHAIRNIARLQEEDSILIQEGASAAGQAAIQISQLAGATIFTTVGTDAEKTILLDHYQIPPDHIFSSENASFSNLVMHATNGKGVDVVLNTLSGDRLTASWECVAPYGRFIDLARRDILDNADLPMYHFRKNTSFISFDAFAWQQERREEFGKILKTVFEMFEKGTLRVVQPLQIYDIGDVQKAFQRLQSGDDLGKVVLDVKHDSMVKTILPTRPSFQLDDKGTYVISGGLGGLGRNISRWLIGRGARNLVLLSRSGAKNEASSVFLKELGDMGVNVVAPPCDIIDEAALHTVLEEYSSNMPPIKGCIQAAMVLKDAVFDRMDYQDWRQGLDCKTIGSWNLHNLLPRDLDFFVMLSSASGIVGIRGQANYAAGNTYLDALARYRVARGEKAISLDLGALIEDGLVAQSPEFLKRVLSYGALAPITRTQFHAILDRYCNPALPVLSPRDCQVIIGLGTEAGSGLDGMDITQQALFSHLRVKEDVGVTSQTNGNAEANLKEMFAASTSFDEATAIVSRALVEKLQRTLSAVDGAADIESPLAALGVDSLLAVELRSWIGKEFQADVATINEILGSGTFASLSALVAGRSKIKHPAWSV